MNKEFWIDTAKRCAWTFSQALLGFMTVGQALDEVNWRHALSVGAVAAIICFLKQIIVYTQIKEEDDE